jgi:hypothetical protein
MWMDDLGTAILKLLFTSSLTFVGGLFSIYAIATVLSYSENAGHQKISKALGIFVISVCVNIAASILFGIHGELGVTLYRYVWNALTIVSFIFLLASMVIVHLESSPAKRIVLIGTTVQFAIYVLGFIVFQLD